MEGKNIGNRDINNFRQKQNKTKKKYLQFTKKKKSLILTDIASLFISVKVGNRLQPPSLEMPFKI